MAFNINEIRSNLSLGGARPSLFQIIMNNPVDAAGDAKMPFMAQAAQIPASTIGTIEVPYFGRKIKIAGDRTFAEWTVTIINDEDFLIRNAMESWVEKMAKLSDNIGNVNPNAYMVTADVYQLGRGSAPGTAGNSAIDNGNENSVLKGYKFIDIFPTAVSPIDLSYDSSDAIEEYTVEFQVNSFEVISNAAANG